MKSNFISYAAHASWQQEILAAAERARKHIHKYLGGLVETENEEAWILIIASGTAVSQSREAIALACQEGLNAGLVKIKSIRPFPEEEIRKLTQKAKAVIVPEFNRVGWMCKEIKSVVEDNTKGVGGTRVFGGMTMPPPPYFSRNQEVFSMNKNLFKISPGFEDIMPAEYRELVHDGPYGKNLGVSDLGTFKELLEEHPLC
ncbi:transketolase C-terminal domain-containing protein, partial [Candidatus Hakubella thermalkaliphila]